jgi:protein-disulfide isomerase
MNTTQGAASVPSTTRRGVLIGSAAAIVAAAAGGAYYLWHHSHTQLAAGLISPAGADVPMSELLQPGPLGDHVMGSANAPVTIVEYASMTCPHCAHFHETTYPQLKKKYIDTGKVRFIFREFPLDALALAASMLARCAGKDKYFPMIEALFAQQKDWVVQHPEEPMLAIAKQAGFTQQSFYACLDNPEIRAGVEENRARAMKLGVNSTPTFFINGKMIRGVLPPDELDKELAPYLKA